MKHYLTLPFILAFSILNISAEPPKPLTKPTMPTEQHSAKSTESAIFAGGCFWCEEAVFDDLPGVISVTSGFTGGHLKNPTYEQVSHENTGHYESVKVVFDPSIISYEKLLENFWPNVDPLDAGGQFCDRGDSYRSAIFYTDDKQKAIAEKSKTDVEKQLKASVATLIVPAETFYPAEDYHQNYHKKNPIRYNTYRFLCGRDKRLNEVWKKKGEVD